MALICLDTEFTNFIDCELISLGIADVSSDRVFYAEVKEVFASTAWSDFAQSVVRPLLHGIESAVPAADFGRHMYEWLRLFPRPVLMLTDEPGYDWFLAKEALGRYAQQLMIEPYRFDSWALGQEYAGQLTSARMNYYAPDRPAHHALHDAMALRAQVIEAMQLGWRPI